MASLGGLISGVLGGAAKAYGEGAQIEMKKQSELDLRKQLLEAESDKRLREDEIKRERDIAEENRKMSPEYLTKVKDTDLIKSQGAIENRVTLAPLAAGADIAEGGAKLGTQIALAPAQAAAAKVTYDAGKPLDMDKAADAVIAKIKETKTLSESPDFIKGTSKLSEATKAAEIKMTQIRADAVKDKPSGGSGSSTVKVRSTYTNSDGNKIAVMSDGTEKTLGKAADYDKTISNLVTKMAKDDYKFAKLPETEKRKQAELRLRGQLVAPSTGLKDLSKYERDKAVND
jgi:hypothetical protein